VSTAIFGSSSMIEIQDIFGEKPISVKISEKEFIDPLIDPLAHYNAFARRWRGMSSHNRPNVREPFTKREPSSIKEFDDLTSIHPTHTRCW
jgi:hypothetical protein